MLNEFCLNNQKIFGENVVKTLGMITTYKSGKRLPQGHILQNDKTSYPYIRITDIDKNTISLDNIKYITQETKNIINKYTNLKECIYVQEEPSNMGAWTFLRPILRDLLPKDIDLSYVGRMRSAASAVGFHASHKKEQEMILKTLFA